MHSTAQRCSPRAQWSPMSKFFIEIGTADFDTCEDLALQGWKGIFVEPVKHLLDNLMRYEGCEYVNAAILEENRPTTIYSLANPKENWQKGISFTSEAEAWGLEIWNQTGQKGDATQKEFLDVCDNSEEMIKNEVEGMTLDTLLDKYDVKHIDFLKIDIEGQEYKILDSYSWKIKPEEIKIEYEHMSTNNVDYKVYVKMLEDMDYVVKVGENDLYAVLDDADGFHGKSYAAFKEEQ